MKKLILYDGSSPVNIAESERFIHLFFYDYISDKKIEVIVNKIFYEKSFRLKFKEKNPFICTTKDDKIFYRPKVSSKKLFDHVKKLYPELYL